MKTIRFRPMRKQEYAQALAKLEARHPWIGKHVFEPAPGHLTDIMRMLELFERQILPEHLPMLYVKFRDDDLTVRYEISNNMENRQDGVYLRAITNSLNLMLELCPVCGAPLDNATRCLKHQGVQGLFAEDVQHSRQAQFKKQKMEPKACDQAQIRPEDQQALTDKEKGKDAFSPKVSAKAKARTTAVVAQPDIAFLDPAGLKCFLEELSTRKNGEARAENIRERIEKAGNGRRKLGVLPPDWRVLLDEFERVFPNFQELTELLRNHFALNALGDQRISWPAILLVGPPGIGKTEAAKWLSERLNLPFRKFDMASAESGSPLSGSEAFWFNSEPGLLFKLLAYEPLANPIVILDELDKTNGHMGYDPLAPLHTLLEKSSAKAFIDLSIQEFSIDASHVNWIATANSIATIPAPILSRLTVLRIAPPTQEQIGVIAQTIYTNLRDRNSWGHLFPEQLDSDVIDLLRQLEPRTILKTISNALGCAAFAGRTIIQKEDIKPFADAEIQTADTTVKQPEIDFLNPTGLDDFFSRSCSRKEDESRATIIIERIKRAGYGRRKLGVLPPDWRDLLDEFARVFPNFQELAGLLRDHFALNFLGNHCVSWPAILLVGAPGIGKTEAAKWLSERLHLPFRKFDMASAESGSPLSGSEAFWANSEPGLLFKLLAYEPLANPIVILDELDKVYSIQSEPLAPLHTLLEKSSAKAFIDLSIQDFSIDASHVNWIATANSLDTIPAPILSRLTVLQIAPPTREQIGTIAQTIYTNLRSRNSWGHLFPEQLDDDVIDSLRQQEPRTILKTIFHALGTAASEKRMAVQKEDVKHIDESGSRRIGFTT